MQGWHRSHIQSETAACLTGLGGFLTIAWRRFVPGRPEKATAACFRLPTWMSEEAGGCVPWGFASAILPMAILETPLMHLFARDVLVAGFVREPQGSRT